MNKVVNEASSARSNLGHEFRRITPVVTGLFAASIALTSCSSTPAKQQPKPMSAGEQQVTSVDIQHAAQELTSDMQAKMRAFGAKSNVPAGYGFVTNFYPADTYYFPYGGKYTATSNTRPSAGGNVDTAKVTSLHISESRYRSWHVLGVGGMPQTLFSVDMEQKDGTWSVDSLTFERDGPGDTLDYKTISYDPSVRTHSQPLTRSQLQSIELHADTIVTVMCNTDLNNQLAATPTTAR